MGDNLKYFRRYFNDVGSKTFEQTPLTQVDMAIFALISYLPFEKIDKDKIINNKICEFSEYFTPYSKDHNIGMLWPVFDLISLISHLDRYKDICLQNFEYKLNCDIEIQFSACTFIIEPDAERKPIAIVAFRGTDGSVVGWKEDLNMSYIDNVPSQNEAAKYLLTLPESLSKFYISGHSKGGYLAMHAAVSYDYSQKIQGVYCFDSPTIWGEPKKYRNWEKVFSKFHCYAPDQSLVSLTLGNTPDLYIVKSDSFSIFQHNPFLWHIKDGKFVKVESLSKQSLVFCSVLQQVYENSSENERKLFINTIFKFIEWLEVDSVEDIVSESIGKPIESIKTISDLSVQEKEILIKFIKLLVSKVKNLRT